MKKVFLLIIYLLSLSFICKAEKGGEQGYLAITYEVVYASCRDHNDPFCYYWIIPIINHNDYNAFPILISADDFYSMFAGKYSYRDTVNLRGNISDFNGSGTEADGQKGSQETYGARLHCKGVYHTNPGRYGLYYQV